MMNRMNLHNGSKVTQNSPHEIDILRLVTRLFQKRRVIACTVLGVMIITAIWMLSTPNVYTSVATVLPSGKTNNLGALQAMIGMASSSQMLEENSSALYPLILRSALIQDGVIDQTYQIATEDGYEYISLAEYFGVEDRDKLRQALRGATRIEANSRTGEIRIAVETRYPDLSQAIVQQYLDELENFNRNKRQSSARNNQKYLAARLALAEHTLHVLEDSLVAFRAANANWAESTDPQLLAEQQRLVREVEIRTQAYLLLTEQHELARFEAQKDIPLVRILDEPRLPTQKSGPYRTGAVLMSGAVTFIFLVVWIILMDLLRHIFKASPDISQNNLKSELREAYPRLLKIKRAAKKVGKKTETISVDS